MEYKDNLCFIMEKNLYLWPSCIQTFSQRLLQDSHNWHLRPSCITRELQLAPMTLIFVNYSFLLTFEQTVYGFKYEPITFQSFKINFKLFPMRILL